MAIAWTDEETRQFIELRERKVPMKEIARRLGKTYHACKAKVTRLGLNQAEKEPSPKKPKAKVSRADLADFEHSAMEVTAEWEDDEQVDAADIWQRAEKQSVRDIEKAKKRSRFKATFGSNPIAISFISDQHIGPGTPCDMQQMRRDAELVRDTPRLFAFLVGDGVDNHIKHRAAVMASRSQPDDQYRLFNFYIQIMREKIVCLISGNHDAWTNQIGGIDMLGWLARHQKLHYSPDEAHIDVSVGGTCYKVAMRHQFRMNSSFNQTHSCKQWMRNFPDKEIPDIVCIGHHHEHAIEQASMFGKYRWLCRPGSYQITSAYSRQYGYNITSPTCPTFVLYPDRHEIVGFGDIRAAVRFLESES